MLSYTEENYLKALLKITLQDDQEGAGTNELAALLSVKPATVTDMLKKLKDKNLVSYEKYGKIFLTSKGKKYGTDILRKHRLWETFLFEKLEFTWDEIHEVAEQLEHIQSTKLIEKLDKFLGHPTLDPHGDVIPTSTGEIKIQFTNTLSEIEVNTVCRMVAVKDNTPGFLQYVVKIGLALNSEIKVLAKQEYDSLMEIEVQGKRSSVSQKFAENIFVVCSNCVIGETCTKKKCQFK